MPEHEDVTRKHIDDLEKGFNLDDFLRAQLQRTPWWLISAGVHGLLFLFICLFQVGGGGGPKKVTFKAKIEKAKEYEIPEPPDLLEADHILEDEEHTQTPVVFEDAEISDHIETPNDEPYEQAKGESEDFLSDKDFSGEGVSDVIGPGAGAGGAYGGRFGGRRKLATRGGGGKKTEEAVLAGLRWLARHQHPDGRWDCDDYTARCKGSICEGKGGSGFDAGVSGLSLLAFLGAGYTHTSTETHDGICFGTVVNNGLKYLKEIQAENGCFGDPSDNKMMYNHAIAALAMTEAYGLTGSFRFKDSAQRSLNFMVEGQNPEKAWRYTPRCGDNDTSVTGWVVMAFKSAKISKLDVPPEVFKGALAWLDEVTDPSYYAVGYTGQGVGSAAVRGVNDDYQQYPAMTAVAVLCRIFMDARPSDPTVAGGAKMLTEAQNLPEWNPSKKTIDYYYWYYGTLALFQYDGPSGPVWGKWNAAMIKALVPNQFREKNTCAYGSWPADTSRGFGKWAIEGGRVYATAINVLSLEVYYRYANVFGGARK